MAKKYHTEVSRRLSPDGREMIITEKEVRCTPECRHESSRRSKRPVTLEVPSSSWERNGSSSAALKERLPTPYRFDFTPDEKRRQERRSGDRDHYHSDGGDYTLQRRNSMHGASKPIPIPPRRSSTVREDDRWRETPRVYQGSSSRRESETVPLGFYDLLYNRGGSPSTRDRYAVKDDDRHHRSHRRRSESPMEPQSKDDNYYRERPSLRRKPRIIQDNVKADIVYGSSPLVGSFGTSYGSHRSSTVDANASTSQSPPKTVRWQDDQRAAQNHRINNRPSRSASFSGAGTGSHQADNVKSILKKSSDHSETAPAVQYPPLSRDKERELYKSAAALPGIEDRATLPQRQFKEEQRDSREMIDSLRERINRNRVEAPNGRRYSFDMPPRRFSGGVWGEKASSRGRRSEVFYDDGRRHW